MGIGTAPIFSRRKSDFSKNIFISGIFWEPGLTRCLPAIQKGDFTGDRGERGAEEIRNDVDQDAKGQENGGQNHSLRPGTEKCSRLPLILTPWSCFLPLRVLRGLL